MVPKNNLHFHAAVGSLHWSILHCLFLKTSFTWCICLVYHLMCFSCLYCHFLQGVGCVGYGNHPLLLRLWEGKSALFLSLTHLSASVPLTVMWKSLPSPMLVNSSQRLICWNKVCHLYRLWSFYWNKHSLLCLFVWIRIVSGSVIIHCTFCVVSLCSLCSARLSTSTFWLCTIR